MQTIICMLWGDRYPVLFVNRLWSMIKRNTNRPTRLICYTDIPAGIDSEIIVCPLPDIHVPDNVWTVWRKLSLFHPNLNDGENLLSGDILFMDIDIVITGCIDSLFDYEAGEYCACYDDRYRTKKIGNPPILHEIGNMSISRFPSGKYSWIYDEYSQDPEGITSTYRQSQEYVSARIPNKFFWPKGWHLNFRGDLLPRWPLNFFVVPKLPSDCLCVSFTHVPDQDDVANGTYPIEKKWKRLYKHVRPTPWVKEHWR